MSDIALDLKGCFISMDEMKDIEPEIMSAHEILLDRKGVSSEMTGWMDYVENMDMSEYEEMKKAGEYIRSNSEAFIILGIGGSYLGARAAIEAVRGDFHNELCSPEVYYAGQNISGGYLRKLTEVVKNKDICIIVISKSGTTLETAISFRILRELMENRYGDEARSRIFVVTDKSSGALKTVSDLKGYKTFVIPDDIGGRFSVLTPVGLLPIAVAGINIDELLQGARNGRENFSNEDVHINICYKYAAARHLLYERGKTTEILVNYEPCLQYFGEWFKQLYGESQGKDGKGIFPASVNFSTDLHSMGQYIQDGMRNIFETIINVEEPQINLSIKEDEENVDGLNFLAGKTIDFVNKRAMEGTVLAHVEGGVPNIVINMKAVNPKALGELIYFFEKSCAIGGYLLGINPFDQEGVEAYKKNMFALLGKPGYEKLQRSLIERLGI